MRIYESYLKEQKLYKVGGSVRDELLNDILGYDLTPKDIDYVAVGYTQEEFEAEYPDAKLVGKDFPVYLVNGDEVALARIERKIDKGHKGFSVDTKGVNLEDDLARRDLTINAIAKDDFGEYTDPFGGMDDIKRKKLKHVTSAFAEDPLRVYRVARFAAKLPDFTLDTKTKELMTSLKDELYDLSVERVWSEVEKALNSKLPSRFFEVLYEADVLDVHFQELYELSKIPAGRGGGLHAAESDAFDHVLNVLNRLKSTNPITRWAALLHDLGKGKTYGKNDEGEPTFYGHDKEGVDEVNRICLRLRCPTVYTMAAKIAAEYHMVWLRFFDMRAGTMIKKLDVVRKFPGGVEEFFKIVDADGKSHIWPIIKKLYKAFDVKLPEEKQDLGIRSGEILHQMRVSALKKILRELKNELL